MRVTNLLKVLRATRVTASRRLPLVRKCSSGPKIRYESHFFRSIGFLCRTNRSWRRNHQFPKSAGTRLQDLSDRAVEEKGAVVIREVLQDGHDEYKPLEIFKAQNSF